MTRQLEIHAVAGSSEVCVRGEILSGSETFITATDGLGEPNGSRINLPHSEVQQALLQEVPCLVGGRYLYIYNCEAIGRLEGDKLTPSAMVVWREDNESEKYSLFFNALSAPNNSLHPTGPDGRAFELKRYV